jgi:DEAD/DEAH box helicase domain-containing protein
MNVDRFLDELRSGPDYAGQIVHIHDEPAHPGAFVPLGELPSPWLRELLAKAGIEQLYSHQHQALSLALAGRDVLVATGTASGKTLCYLLPILQALHDNPKTPRLSPKISSATANAFSNWPGSTTCLPVCSTATPPRTCADACATGAT